MNFHDFVFTLKFLSLFQGLNAKPSHSMALTPNFSLSTHYWLKIIFCLIVIWNITFGISARIGTHRIRNHKSCAFILQLKRLNELEDIVADQDNSLAAMRHKITQARQEIQNLKIQNDDTIRAYDKEKSKLVHVLAESLVASECYVMFESWAPFY